MDQLYTSIFVAPLHIQKGTLQVKNRNLFNLSMSASSEHATTDSNGEMTPPLTPHTPHESHSGSPFRENIWRSEFHTYLRASFTYQPPCDENSTTVTLPFELGDIIFIHSVHMNGWADGTLLTSGTRGWLPTNYCEPYGNEPMRILLKAFTHFWDLVKGTTRERFESFKSQDYIRGMGAGVRYLLEKTDCLSRVSTLNQLHQGIRRNRKVLLSDLTALVKAARGLESAANGERTMQLTESDLDDMVQKAFKMVNQAVKFLDFWSEVIAELQRLEKSQENFNVPPTPPAERAEFGTAEKARMQEIPEPASASVMTCQALPGNHEDCEVENRPRYSRSSPMPNRPDSGTYCVQPRNSISARNQRASISHRASCSARPSGSFNSNLASEKLSSCHDTFLSFLASFIGLHLQSRSSAELLATTQQSVVSCQSMLSVVDAIWERDGKRSDLLEDARGRMYQQITDLAGAARDLFRPIRVGSQDDLLMPEQEKPLVDAATVCVRVAGECVAESRFVIERIGDFEFQPLGVEITNFEDFGTRSSSEHMVERKEFPSSVESEEPRATPQTSCSPPPPPSEVIEPSFPPPPPPRSELRAGALPAVATAAMSGFSVRSTWPSQAIPPNPSDSRTSSSFPSHPPIVSPLQDPFTAYENNESFSSIGALGDDLSHQADISRVDSFDVSNASECNVHRGRLRDSETSAVSQTSTRATSPDVLPAHNVRLPSGGTSLSGSRLTLNDECEETEVDMLEKTFAHELVYNKDGQISGGTLPALIERLTTHDSTPDATFVSTFYLTFRLFATPLEFAEALIDRFRYVEDSPKIAGPVRLRVYNVFKGWLESHWRNDCDSPALELILSFARRQLLLVLPTAGKRLAVLAEKVGATDATLVPRLVSSMGKTNTSIAQYVAPDAPMPAPIITKSQLSVLKNWKLGGAMASILDFDPLELARQFTIKESRIFCSILPEELLATEWMKKSGSMAVNVRAMSTLSTDLANLVADSILQLEDPKKRAAVIKQWVKIANKCLELANYDSLIAVVCALNTSNIIRLERTWSSVSSKTKSLLEQLKGIVDVSRNYAVLRQRLRNHVPPCLPFVGTYLTDLTFVDVGNQTTRQLAGEGGEESRAVINFDKHMKTAKIISDLQRFQIPYRFVEIPELQTWIQDQLVRVRSSDQSDVLSYYRRSLILEPREAMPIRGSPAESQQPSATFSSSTTTNKERFDRFGMGWAHHSREKIVASSRVTTPT